MKVRLDIAYKIALGYVDLVWISNFIFSTIYLGIKYLLYLKNTYLGKSRKVKYS